MDSVTIEQIVGSDQGVAGFLEGIQEALRAKTYQPQAVQCWFDALFYGPQGPARKADVKLVRHADDFVALAKRLSRISVYE